MPRHENLADLTIVGRKIGRKINREISNKQMIDVRMNTKTIEAYQKVADRFVYLKAI